MGVLALRAAAPDEPAKDPVGIVEGDSILVQGAMSAIVVDGKVKTVLRSGGDLRVKSGRATIDLIEGGKIAVCGPAHLSVLKSGGALTVALDSGTIHSYVDQGPSLTIYTALLQAKPLAIGGAPQETLFNLDTSGGLSVRAIGGAVRIEQQLSGQSIVVPQSGDVLLGITTSGNSPNVLRAIRMSRARRLLADGVGLSKTIQAGLVITELIARRLFEALMASLSRRLGHLKLEIFAWAISGVKMLSLHQR